MWGLIEVNLLGGLSPQWLWQMFVSWYRFIPITIKMGQLSFWNHRITLIFVKKSHCRNVLWRYLWNPPVCWKQELNGTTRQLTTYTGKPGNILASPVTVVPVVLGLTRAAVIWIHLHILHFATSCLTLILRKMIQRPFWLVHCGLSCASGRRAIKSLTQKFSQTRNKWFFI